jgi:YHS domain-containing protein
MEARVCEDSIHPLQGMPRSQRPTINTSQEIAMNRFSIALITVVALALTACAPLVTQNPGGKISPANVHEMDGNDRVMLKGADVVAYWLPGGGYKQGNPAIKSTYENITFYFSSAENKALFDKEPAKYLPEFGGYCANGIVYSIPWGGDADTFVMIGGKLYMFGGAGSRDAFMLDPQKNVALANKYWGEEVSGSNALMHRTKRTTVARVAHYKSGAELAADVAKAKK